jgi:flagellar basal-body rod protein FlgB
MSKVFFEDNSISSMEKFLDLAVQRQSLISSNLANGDTPGYKTVDINFEQELGDAMSGLNDQQTPLRVTNFRHIALPADGSSSAAAVKQVEGLTSRNDLNNVNIDREMAHLSTNALRFSMIAQLLAGKFHTLKAAIMEGR